MHWFYMLRLLKWFFFQHLTASQLPILAEELYDGFACPFVWHELNTYLGSHRQYHLEIYILEKHIRFTFTMQ